jgi:hypothetical protein
MCDLCPGDTVGGMCRCQFDFMYVLVASLLNCELLVNDRVQGLLDGA